LFKTHNVVDAVWIGAKNNSNWAKFKWDDDSDLGFTNWAEGSPSNITGNNCVQIAPEGSSKGKWVDEPCNKKNLVICQKMQIWSLSHIQESFLEFRKNPVPIGFIYVQLPSQPEPKTLWPIVEWKDVTPDYAGLFFRAEGGGAAAFGETQSDNSPRLTDIEFKYDKQVGNVSPLSIVPGTWSSYIFSGKFESPVASLRFMVSSVEVRPRNKAIRIWKRTN